MALEVGRRLGPYQVLALLGAGGMGEVYRARDTRLDRIVALKVMAAHLAADTSRRARFEREARTISRLSHPQICALYDVGDQDGLAFLIMEYIEGQTLQDRLEQGALPLDQTLRFAAQIAEALAAAHRQGVIHRDLKPANVMLTREGLKLMDFGLAKLLTPESEETRSTATETLGLTEEGVILGTMPYMAPEQLEGKNVDARTDIFALGVVVYEMATGRRPFQGRSRASLIAAILTTDPAPLATLQPMTPPLLERVVRRCLAKDPGERWQSTSDLAAELRWFLEGGSEAGAARPIAARGKARTLLWGSLLGAALVAAGVAGLATLGRESRPLPSYEQVTFQRGTLTSARFAPDGQTIVYSAAWEGRPTELFTTRRGSIDSRALGLTRTRVVSISSSAEMLLLDDAGTLSRAPLAGGAPRALLEGVIDADWIPGGSEIAVVRSVGRSVVVEFPMGKTAYETTARIWRVRVSPRGDLLAFFEGPFVGRGSVLTLNRSGAKTRLGETGYDASGMAWSPDGKEVWFTAGEGGEALALRALSLSGKMRLLARMPAWLYLNDALPDGKMLLGVDRSMDGMVCLAPNESKERDLSWLDHSWAQALSSDGKTVLFVGRGRAGAGGQRYAIYLRNTDGSSPVRLGEGSSHGLSPDGHWVVSTQGSKDLSLLPTGAGTSRRLPAGAIVQFRQAGWVDSNHIVFSGNAEGRPIRIYVQDVETGEIRPITPEGVNLPEAGAAMPDGKHVVGRIGAKWSLYPVDGGDPHPLPSLRFSDVPIQWSADGRTLFAASYGDRPAVDVFRVELATGRRELVKTLSPPDPAGFVGMPRVVLTPDGKSYCYTYQQKLGTLFVADGLK